MISIFSINIGNFKIFGSSFCRKFQINIQSIIICNFRFGRIFCQEPLLDEFGRKISKSKTSNFLFLETITSIYCIQLNKCGKVHSIILGKHYTEFSCCTSLTFCLRRYKICGNQKARYEVHVISSPIHALHTITFFLTPPKKRT